MPDRWLLGLVCCALDVEGQAVLAALHRRGVRARSVPTGAARGAWTAAVTGGTLGVVVTGRGAAAAAAAAEFWAPRTRCAVVCAALPATAPVAAATLAADGDADLVAAVAARRRDGGPAIRGGRVATVAEMPLRPAARESLAASGFVAAAPETDVWRGAAAAVQAGFLVCAGLVDAVADAPPPIPAGHTGPPWWRRLVPTAGSARRAERRRREDALSAAAGIAASAALGVLLGPEDAAPEAGAPRR